MKSTAVLFGDHIRPILSAFGALFIASLVYAGLLINAGAAFFVISVLGAAAQLMWQMVTLDFDDGAQCWSVFKVRIALPLILARLSRVVFRALGQWNNGRCHGLGWHVLGRFRASILDLLEYVKVRS